MNSTEHLEPSCDTLSMTATEAQWSLQMSTLTLKQETVECIDEEESPCTDDMCPFIPLKSSNYVNYYDSKICVLDEMKKEFPVDEHPQSDCSKNSKIVTEDKESLKFIDKQRVKDKNVEKGFSIIKNQESNNKKYWVTIKMESLEEQDIFDNTKMTSIHYDALVTPQDVQCKLCGRIFKNSFKLLKHNNRHLQVNIYTPRDNEIYKLQEDEYCDKGFNNHDNNMFAYDNDVHRKKIPKCGKQLKIVSNLDHHVLLLDKHKNSPKQLIRNNLKCKYSNVDFENRYTLCKLMKLCRTGKEDGKKKYKCDSCERVYTTKKILTIHMKRIHYDYGRTFDCWCGKYFRSPSHLSDHKRQQQHDGDVKDTNRAKFQCDSCQEVFKNKLYLLRHIKRMHYDYGQVFECCCGKQFRTPIHLRDHKKTLLHGYKRRTTITTNSTEQKLHKTAGRDAT